MSVFASMPIMAYQVPTSKISWAMSGAKVYGRWSRTLRISQPTLSASSPFVRVPRQNRSSSPAVVMELLWNQEVRTCLDGIPYSSQTASRRPSRRYLLRLRTRLVIEAMLWRLSRSSWKQRKGISGLSDTIDVCLKLTDFICNQSSFCHFLTLTLII